MRERLYNFDIVKIIAAILIVFHHYQQLSNVSFQQINFYGGRFSFGYLVELFFIISGFLTAMSWNYKQGLGKLVLKRIKRIVPMSSVAVLFNLVIFIIYQILTGNCMFNTDYNSWQIITSLLLVNQGWAVEFSPAVNNPIWYLCVLLWLSLLYTTISVVTKEHKEINLLCSGILVLVGIIGWKMKIDFPFLHLSDFRGYTTFFYGVVLYCFYERAARKKQIAMALVFLMCSILGMSMLGISNWYVLVVLFFPGIVMFAVSIPQINKPIISFMGNVSYEVYLWHMPIYCLIKLYIDVLGIKFKHSYLTMIMFTVVVWLISMLLYQLVERKISK